MISALKNEADIAIYFVHEAVLLGDPARPNAGEFVLERFGVADALEWILQAGFDQPRNPPGSLAVGADPVLVVLPALAGEC